MKYSKILFSSLLSVAVAVGFSSCDNDDLHIDGPDAGSLVGSDANVVYVTDGLGNQNSSFSFNGSGTFNIYAQTSKAIVGTCTVQFAYDATKLEAYNEAHGTSYEAVPESMVQMSNGGKATFTAGALKSDPLQVTVSGNGQLDPDKTYALPMAYFAENGHTVDGADAMVVLVRDYSTYPGTDKTFNGAPGMKMVACFEVNDENPLNAIGFKVKDSGKQLFDMVVLFSANININKTTGAPYISCNENVRAILSNADKYIRPLQERGMKVILGLLGNWDASGLSTFTPETSKYFAVEVKNFCDTYGLDGVLLDDEYTDYDAAASGNYPGFQAQSYESSSRIAYDIKQAQPERLNLVYRYAGYDKGVEIDGVQPGQFMDYVFNNYGVTSDPTTVFPGLRQDQAGTGSWECSDWAQWIPRNSNYAARFSLTGMREDGYGALLIFNFKTNPDYWLTPYIISSLDMTSEAFYGEGIEYDGVYYTKDWN